MSWGQQVLALAPDREAIGQGQPGADLVAAAGLDHDRAARGGASQAIIASKSKQAPFVVELIVGTGHRSIGMNPATGIVGGQTAGGSTCCGNAKVGALKSFIAPAKARADGNDQPIIRLTQYQIDQSIRHQTFVRADRLA